MPGARYNARVLWVLFHIVGLWAIAVAQPLFGLLAANPEFFVAHRAGVLDVLLLTLALAIVPPVLLAIVVRAAGLAGARARAAALDLVLGGLTCTLAMQVAVRAGAARWFVAMPVAAAAGVVAALAYRRLSGLRSFFSVLSMAGLVVPALFVLEPGIRTLLSQGLRSDERSGTRAATQGTAASAPVVLVIFDELPLASLLDSHGALDRLHYPNFAALAGDGIWFRNATTVADFTRWAVPAIVSGSYPRARALPAAVSYPNTIFTLLGRTHRMEVIEPVTSLCPERYCPPEAGVSAADRLGAMGRDLRVVFLRLVLTPDLAGSLPDPTQSWARFGDDGRGPVDADALPRSGSTQEAIRRRWKTGMTTSHHASMRQFVESIGKEDAQPTLYFVHTLASHHPHYMLPNGQANGTSIALPETEDAKARVTAKLSWPGRQYYQRHLLQMGFVDNMVGRLVTRLKDSGLYDRALVVITADHGMSYLPGSPSRNFTELNAPEIMRVPLIIKLPAHIPVFEHESAVNAETIDILPTIADALDVRIPWSVDGESLIEPARRDRPGKVMFRSPDSKRLDYPAAGPDIGPVLLHKRELFGDAAGSWGTARAPLVPGFDQLLGQPLAALRVAEGGDAVELVNAPKYDAVDVKAAATVFDVGGRFGSPHPEAIVAVAVNGVVEAVTRTWEKTPRGWLATPRPNAWRPGRNAIEVFLVERDGAGLLLRRAPQQLVRPAGLNLILDEAREQWGVGQWGFYSVQRRDGVPYRWTRDRAELSNLVSYTRPREVQVEVLGVAGDTPKELKIEADGCLLFDGPVKSGWSSTLSLARCDLSRGLTLRFGTTARRAAGTTERHGVAISRVVLR